MTALACATMKLTWQHAHTHAHLHAHVCSRALAQAHVVAHCTCTHTPCTHTRRHLHAGTGMHTHATCPLSHLPCAARRRDSLSHCVLMTAQPVKALISADSAGGVQARSVPGPALGTAGAASARAELTVSAGIRPVSRRERRGCPRGSGGSPGEPCGVGDPRVELEAGKGRTGSWRGSGTLSPADAGEAQGGWETRRDAQVWEGQGAGEAERACSRSPGWGGWSGRLHSSSHGPPPLASSVPLILQVEPGRRAPLFGFPCSVCPHPPAPFSPRPCSQHILLSRDTGTAPSVLIL